jgi:uncharacterized protein (DUF488 family)
MHGEIFTVGHSNRSAEAFLAVLEYYGVQRLVDVRTRPRSRWPQFAQPALAALVRDAGIDYVWLGETLGGLRAGGYTTWMASDVFAQGLTRLEALAAERPTAFMCAERDPAHCHRRYIAAALLARGWTVRHLIAPGEDYPAEPVTVQLPLRLT